MTTSVVRGAPATLLAEWRLYAGGPYADVTGVTIAVVRIVDSVVVLSTTTTGVTSPAVGINAYVWTPAPSLTIGDYLVTWTGTDPDSEIVQATEVVTVQAGGALGGPYADRATLKRRMGIPDTDTLQDGDVDDALSSASDAINQFTGRQFGQASEASTRTYVAGPSGVDTDDFWTTDGLLVNGSSTTYALEPANGIVNGVPGWPYSRLVSPYNGHPIYDSGSMFVLAVEVTARWGWARVPSSIKSACLMLAADTLKSKDAPFGVAGFGDYVVRVRANPKVAELLAPYVRDPIKAGS